MHFEPCIKCRTCTLVFMENKMNMNFVTIKTSWGAAVSIRRELEVVGEKQKVYLRLLLRKTTKKTKQKKKQKQNLHDCSCFFSFYSLFSCFPPAATWRQSFCALSELAKLCFWPLLCWSVSQHEAASSSIFSPFLPPFLLPLSLLAIYVLVTKRSY